MKVRTLNGVEFDVPDSVGYGWELPQCGTPRAEVVGWAPNAEWLSPRGTWRPVCVHGEWDAARLATWGKPPDHVITWESGGRTILTSRELRPLSKDST